MNETPDRPPVPDGDPDPPTTPFASAADDRDPGGPHGLDDTDGPGGPGGTGGTGGPGGPGGDREPDFGDLPPLGDMEDPPARRALTPLRLIAAVGVVAVAAVAFIGLSGSDGDGGDDPTDGVASIDGSETAEGEADDDSGGGGGGRIDDSEFQDAMLEFTECMREQGIDMPDPVFDDGAGGGGVMIGGGPDEPGTGPSQEEMEAAEEACGSIMDEVRPDIQLTPEEQAEMQDEMVALSQCMRDKGWDMPDPQVNEDGSVMVERQPGDETSGRAPSPENQEQNQADMEACHEELGIDRRGPDAPATDGGES